jgi:hypothetical protein
MEKFLEVKFKNNLYDKKYTYAYSGSVIPEVGDDAVVFSPVDNRYTIVTVVGVKDSTRVHGYKYITHLLSYAEIRREKEREIQRTVLRRELDAEKKRYIEQLEFETLKKFSPKAAELVEKLKALS